MVWALPLIPLGSSLLSPWLRRASLVAAAAMTAVVATLVAAVLVFVASPGAATWSWGPDLKLELAAAGFGRVMVLLVPAIAAPVIGYALATERDARTRLVTLLVAFVGAMELLVLAADFLTLLVGWELVGALSWALISHAWRDADNPKQGVHAFLTTRAGDLGLYVAAGAVFASTGQLTFTALEKTTGPWLQLAAGGVLLAAAGKSAQVPFSPWLFSAMAGPTPVSALLHSATMVSAGAYLLIRVAPLLEPVTWLRPAAAALGLVTALAGGLVASTQTHAKRLLAGSTSAQYGLMFVAVGAGSTAAAAVHLVAHAGFKALLFLGAGVAMHVSGSGRLQEMQLGRALPGVALLSAVGALALAAVPPLGGAWTKEEIVAAASHASAWLGSGALLAGLVSAFYALRYQLLVYGPGPVTLRRRHELRTGEGLPLAFLALFSLALGILWLPRADRVVENLTGGRLAGASGSELLLSLTLIACGSGVTWWLSRSRDLLSLGLPEGVSRAAAQWLGLPAAARVVVADPVLALSRLLARVDDRVIDAGVHGAARIAASASRLLSLRAEVRVDSVVRAIAAACLMAARGSRVADERAVDKAIEGIAGGVGAAGRDSRRLQTGLSHQYYVFVAAGFTVLVGVLALVR